MPEIFIDDNGNTSDSVGFDGVTESQRVEQAKAELISEQYGTPPPLILGKFTSQDALAASYQSLESEAGRLRAELATFKAGGKAPPAEATPPAEAQPSDPPPAAPPAEAAPPATPGQPQSLSIEQQERIRHSLLAQAGGEEEFGKLATWASGNLTQDRLTRFNEALTAGNEAEALTALKAMQFDRITANGYEPKLLGGSPQAQASVKPFASEVEVTTAMNDPRYSGPDADPAYIQQVTERLAISSLFG